MLVVYVVDGLFKPEDSQFWIKQYRIGSENIFTYNIMMMTITFFFCVNRMEFQENK